MGPPRKRALPPAAAAGSEPAPLGLWWAFSDVGVGHKNGVHALPLNTLGPDEKKNIAKRAIAAAAWAHVLAVCIVVQVLGNALGGATHDMTMISKPLCTPPALDALVESKRYTTKKVSNEEFQEARKRMIEV